MNCHLILALHFLNKFDVLLTKRPDLVCLTPINLAIAEMQNLQSFLGGEVTVGYQFAITSKIGFSLTRVTGSDQLVTESYKAIGLCSLPGSQAMSPIMLRF